MVSVKWIQKLIKKRLHVLWVMKNHKCFISRPRKKYFVKVGEIEVENPESFKINPFMMFALKAAYTFCKTYSYRSYCFLGDLLIESKKPKKGKEEHDKSLGFSSFILALTLHLSCQIFEVLSFQGTIRILVIQDFLLTIL